MFATWISKDGDGVSALILSPRPLPALVGRGFRCVCRCRRRLGQRQLCSLGYVAHRDAERFRDTLAVSGIRLQTIADVADLDRSWGVAHGAGSVVEEQLLLPVGDDDPE